MKITKIQIENFKKINSLNVDNINGCSIYLVGKNNVGKSSVIHAIYYALGKEKIDNAITAGADSGKIGITLRDNETQYNVECVLHREKDKLTITSANGTKVPNPERFLKSITENLLFDPFSLILMDRKKKVETLKKILGVDTNALDEEYKQIYEYRKELNIRERTLKDRAKNIPETIVTADTKKIPLDDFKAKIKQSQEITDRRRDIEAKANAKKSDIASMENKCNMLIEKKQRLEEEIKNLIAMIEEKEGQIDAIKNIELKQANNAVDSAYIELKEIESGLDSIEDIDISKVMNDYDRAVKHNENVDNILKDIEVINQISEIKESIKSETEKLNDIISQKQDIISKSLKGEINMSIDDDEIFIDGIKLDPMNMNTAGIIDFGLAINRIMNPGLRILRIQNASLLDDQHLNDIIEKCESDGYQLFIEKVDSNNETLQVQIIENA